MLASEIVKNLQDNITKHGDYNVLVLIRSPYAAQDSDFVDIGLIVERIKVYEAYIIILDHGR